MNVNTPINFKQHKEFSCDWTDKKDNLTENSETYVQICMEDTEVRRIKNWTKNYAETKLKEIQEKEPKQKYIKFKRTHRKTWVVVFIEKLWEISEERGKNITDTKIRAKEQTKVSLCGMKSWCDEKNCFFLFLKQKTKIVWLTIFFPGIAILKSAKLHMCET